MVRFSVQKFVGSLLMVAAVVVGLDSCWDKTDECVINANLYFSASVGQVDLPIAINCTSETESLSPVTDDQRAFLQRRYENVQNISLDGCHAPLNAATFGFEFIPNCGHIVKATVGRFHVDELRPLSCPPVEIMLEILSIKHNELVTIASDSLRNLKKLRELYITANFLRHIDRDAFHGMANLEVIHLEQEENLSIKDSDIFAASSVANIRLIALRQINADLLTHLPESVHSIEIAQTPFDSVGTVTVENPHFLRIISITKCTLRSFVLNDRHLSSTVVQLNLSGNALTEFQVNNSTSLQILDLSGNGLTHFPAGWLRDLKHLKQLVLSGNRLKTFSLVDIFQSTHSPALSHIDLRENDLSAITGVDREDVALGVRPIRIRIDRNPWNCMWLLNLSHSQPEKYHVFQYEKYIAKINVNGLECVFSSSAKHKKLEFGGDFSITPPTPMSNNASIYTMIYGNPRDLKRNQRAEALIIVFMLPLGIALLFLLLYLWIYCQKVFHLSYYRSFPLGRSTADRFDVVRHAPAIIAANNNQGYEIPLNGGGPVICNNNSSCATDNHPCDKININYDDLPPAPSVKIYEEIVGDDESPTPPYAFYDHLVYADAAARQNDK